MVEVKTLQTTPKAAAATENETKKTLKKFHLELAEKNVVWIIAGFNIVISMRHYHLTYHEESKVI